MIRGAYKVVKTDTEKDVLDQPDIIKPDSIYEIIYKAIKKSKSKGMTNSDLTKSTHIHQRRIREATQALKLHSKIKLKHCRCGHSPIYYI